LAAAQQNTPGTRWEYTILPRPEVMKRGNGQLATGLNRLGEEGWELLALQERDSQFYFKRVKRAEQPLGLATNQLDPGSIFDHMAQGTAPLNLSDLRFGQAEMQEWAQKQGITNGQLTRDQFRSYFESSEAHAARERILGQFRGGAGGGNRPVGPGV